MLATRMMMASSIKITFPSVVTTNSSNNNNTSSFSVSLPSGIVAGNLLLMMVSVSRVSISVTINTPSGWTQLYADAGPNDLRRCSCFYKTASGSEGASVTVSTSAAVEYAANTYRITGNLSAVPQYASTIGTSQNADPPSITPTWKATRGSLLIATASQHVSGSAPTNPTNYGNQVTGQEAGGSSVRVSSARRTATVVTEDPSAFGLSTSADWHASIIAIS